MGSSGSYLKSGGFTHQEWEQVGSIKGVKVLKKNGTKEGIKGGLPLYSNTPGTAYILLDADGKFSQFRQYSEDRKMKFDIDYGRHNSSYEYLHIHYYDKNGHKKKTEVIALPNNVIINKNLYEKYKGFLKGINL
ncbi:hypothetical protein IJG12_01515 [Candidatus Saccharibacteria bacterium]|nr:hypothetical protein [Candidatus Saccharibacteria bacterium]